VIPNSHFIFTPKTDVRIPYNMCLGFSVYLKLIRIGYIIERFILRTLKSFNLAKIGLEKKKLWKATSREDSVEHLICINKRGLVKVWYGKAGAVHSSPAKRIKRSMHRKRYVCLRQLTS